MLISKNKLIYISNARIPSDKANTYQSFVMCEAFSKHFNKLEFWFAKRKNFSNMKNVESPFKFYSVKEVFLLKELYSVDLRFLFSISPKIWHLLQNISFSINCIWKLIRSDLNDIVLSRDTIGLKFLSLAKKVGLIKQKTYFEAHVYSKKISDCCKDIDGLIVINQYLKKLYEKDGLKNILVAHDAVKIEEYTGLTKRIKSNIFNIVYTGNIFAWKGVYTLVDSMKYLDTNVKLIIVGGSVESLPVFKKYVEDKQLKNVEIVGFVPKIDTLKYIDQADVLILPNSAKDKMSFYTSPLKLFEYMASKRPIVASKLPSIEEVLADGKNAILFEPDNAEDLAMKIKWIINNNCDKIIEQAYTDVLEYTWDKRAESIMKWMNEETKNKGIT